jgi:regulator of sigma E protease
VGETEYAIGAIPAGGYVKISGMNPDEDLPEEVRDRAYHAQPVWKRIAVIAAGPIVNLVLAFVLLFAFFAFVGAETSPKVAKVASTEKSYPARGVLQKGDRIVAVDGKRGDTATIAKRVSSHKCAGAQVKGCRAATPARLTVLRDGRERTISLRPVYDATPQVDRTRLGFAFEPGPHETLPVGEAASTSLDRFWFVTSQTVTLPVRLFNSEQRKQVSGVVGISTVSKNTVQDDLGDSIALLALVSLSLAIINLFPFLPLDGGHIFWAIVEKVRGRPVPLITMERAGMVGFVLVIGLFILGLTNDIGRLTGEGFQQVR